MTSVLNVDTIADKAGTGPVALTKQDASKMYCSFVQSSATNEVSLNISSLTDVGTGQTTANYTNNFSDTKHPVVGTSNWNGVFTTDTYTTSSNLIRGRNADSTALADRGRMQMIGSGDLA